MPAFLARQVCSVACSFDALITACCLALALSGNVVLREGTARADDEPRPAFEAPCPGLLLQAFNMPFDQVAGRLHQWSQRGVTGVVISPPQLSSPEPDWWGRYQPVDYSVIDGPLGNRNALEQLFVAARSEGVDVYVDAVINHMADVRALPDLSYPQFSAEHFNPPDTRPCVQDFSDREQALHGWLCDFRATLPDLNTRHPHVRAVHQHYLKDLMQWGAAGFRFDAAVNVEPETFVFHADALRRAGFAPRALAEVVGTSRAEVDLYADPFSLTDFESLAMAIGVFDHQQPAGKWLFDLRQQQLRPIQGNETPRSAARVPFVRTHDALFHADFFNFASADGLELTLRTLLSFHPAGAGPFLILDRDLDDVRWAAALSQRSAAERSVSNCLADPQRVGCAPRTMWPALWGSKRCPAPDPSAADPACAQDRGPWVAWSQSPHHFSLLNPTWMWLNVGDAEPVGVTPGCYVETRYGFLVKLDPVKGAKDTEPQKLDLQPRLSRWAGSAANEATIGPRTLLQFRKLDGNDVDLICGTDAENVR